MKLLLPVGLNVAMRMANQPIWHLFRWYYTVKYTRALKTRSNNETSGDYEEEEEEEEW